MLFSKVYFYEKELVFISPDYILPLIFKAQMLPLFVSTVTILQGKESSICNACILQFKLNSSDKAMNASTHPTPSVIKDLFSSILGPTCVATLSCPLYRFSLPSLFTCLSGFVSLSSPFTTSRPNNLFRWLLFYRNYGPDTTGDHQFRQNASGTDLRMDLSCYLRSWSCCAFVNEADDPEKSALRRSSNVFSAGEEQCLVLIPPDSQVLTSRCSSSRLVSPLRSPFNVQTASVSTSVHLALDLKCLCKK